MRIGILTLPQETNYGGILQAFALQRTLRKMGHDAITIDRHNRKGYSSLLVHIAGYCKRLLQHYILGRKNVPIKWNANISPDEFKLVSGETQKFIERNILLTRSVFSDELAEIEKEYQFDAYVVGSDQVWLEYYCPSSFLSFVHREGVKRVCYAASCGKKSFFNYPDKVKQCRNLAPLFDGISVREDYLIPLCKDKLGVDAQWVLDPTMLLDPKDYLDASLCNVDNTPILFSYILDPDHEKDTIINSIADMLSVPIVNGSRIYETGSSPVYPSVDDWLYNINRAKFVVTDSFHGTVFSILFNKPFLSIGNARRGMARFQSLLKRFGLEDRLIFINGTETDYLTKVRESIDYDKVNHYLSIERVKSFNFIVKSLD